MVQIGDIGRRILRNLDVDMNNCPNDFPVYQRIFDEAYKIRSKLIKELNNQKGIRKC